jgi:hypothetical protein
VREAGELSEEGPLANAARLFMLLGEPQRGGGEREGGHQQQPSAESNMVWTQFLRTARGRPDDPRPGARGARRALRPASGGR